IRARQIASKKHQETKSMNDPINVANQWIAAYNTKDFGTLRNMMTDDIHVEHHNRGIALDGADAMLAIMTQFAGLVPDRRFHSVRRQFASDKQVVTELTWEATPTTDIEGFAKKGEKIRLELASIWTIRDGRIAEYHDYG
ncbi:MAG: nuclear transport factor 2 family protein, partial [Gammaproteobacteria bacterium]